MPSFNFLSMVAIHQFLLGIVFRKKGRSLKARMASSLDSLRSHSSIWELAINPEFGILESDRKYFLTDVFCPIEQIFGNTFAREKSLNFNKY